MQAVRNQINAAYIGACLTYLSEIIQTRLALSLGEETPYGHIGEITPPGLNGLNSPFMQFLIDHSCKRHELVVITLALVPHILPAWLGSTIREVMGEKPIPTQLGLIRGKDYQGFLPTGQTVLYLLAGDNIQRRWDMQELFGEGHFFSKKKVLFIEEVKSGEPKMSGRLILQEEYVEWLLSGRISRPQFSSHFPAQFIQTDLSWKDLVLNKKSLKQIQELEAWIQHGPMLLHEWGMKKRYKLGYRALFHGPPGTGKTLTATLLGKSIGQDVFKVDLSMVVSKYIGETEKNLANLFDKAENKRWILFFDEADALFGKRTNVQNAHDKYANQEVSFLLQRVEQYDGLVILASNFKSNIDDAFLRRFQTVIHFPMPKAHERLAIWEKSFPSQLIIEETINLKEVAQKYELSGASITNIALKASLLTMNKGSETVDNSCLMGCISSEFNKHGKIM
ncbi:MAG: ATP-binding protein [Bacteroidota bacterium]